MGKWGGRRLRPEQHDKRRVEISRALVEQCRVLADAEGVAVEEFIGRLLRESIAMDVVELDQRAAAKASYRSRHWWDAPC